MTQAIENILPAINNKREMPCEDTEHCCLNMRNCASLKTDCRAFRCWTEQGNYKTEDVTKFIRALFIHHC